MYLSGTTWVRVEKLCQGGRRGMKTYGVFFMATILCLSVFPFVLAEAEGADWKVLREDTYGNSFSYDAASVKKTETNTIMVWARSDGAKYLYEIDCKERKARLLEGTGSSGSQWFAVTAGSGDEMLFQAVCP